MCSCLPAGCLSESSNRAVTMSIAAMQRNAGTCAILTVTGPVVLLQSGILEAPEDDVNYLTAAAGPSEAYAPRKFCSVCGFNSA
jgi:hypothetical protein